MTWMGDGWGGVIIGTEACQFFHQTELGVPTPFFENHVKKEKLEFFPNIFDDPISFLQFCSVMLLQLILDGALRFYKL